MGGPLWDSMVWWGRLGGGIPKGATKAGVGRHGPVLCARRAGGGDHNRSERGAARSERRPLRPQASTAPRSREIVLAREIRRKELRSAQRAFGCRHGFAARPVSS